MDKFKGATIIMNFESIKSLFRIKTKPVNISSENNTPTNSQEYNKDCDFDNAYETIGVSSRASFLASQNIQNKKRESQTPLTDVDITNLKTDIKNFCEKDKILSNLNDDEMTNVINAITQDATKEVALKRMDNFKKIKTLALYSSIFEGKPNSSFILDNVDDFNKIFNRENSRLLFADLFSLIDCADKKEVLDELKKYADDPIDLAANATMILYNSKEHTRGFGDEIVEVDSAFLLNLLSEYQDWRGYEKFNEQVEKLTEKNHRNSNETNYYKLAEGILMQKPQLYDIVNLYRSYINIRCKDVDPETAIRYKQHFLDELDTTGMLPHKVELKTIVPDDNALSSPARTCEIICEQGLC